MLCVIYFSVRISCVGTYLIGGTQRLEIFRVIYDCTRFKNVKEMFYIMSFFNVNK